MADPGAVVDAIRSTAQSCPSTLIEVGKAIAPVCEPDNAS
jgi:hypothetical protein